MKRVLGFLLVTAQFYLCLRGLADPIESRRPRANPKTNDELAQVVIELRDGSKLIGTLGLDSLPLQTSFGKLDLPAHDVAAVDFNDDQETAIVQSTAGDRLRAVILLDTFKVKSSFGMVQIPLATIARLSLRVPHTKAAGLILYYSFDKDEGSVVTDQSGSSHTGKVCGATHSDSGIRGGAESFNGVNGFIQVGDLGRVEEGTMSFWMKPDEVTHARAVLSSDFNRGGYCIRFEETVGGSFAAGELTRYCDAEFTRSLAANNWYHVAFVWNRTEAWGYLDGKRKFSLTHTRPGVPGLNLSLSDMVIGKGYSNEPSRHWKGLVDEFRLFNRMLDGDEIAQLYKREGTSVLADKQRFEQRQRRAEEAEFNNTKRRPARGLNAGLALYYDFDEEEGEKVTDRSGHERDGEAIRARFIPEGRRGGALWFDGNSSINVGNVFNLDGATRDLTVCLWVKAAPITGVSNWASLIGKSQEQSPWPGWGIAATPSSRASAGISCGYPQLFDAGSRIPICDGQWHFVCAIFEVADDSMKILLYTDGEPCDYSEWVGPHPSPVNSTPLTIGQRAPGGSGGFQGALDEVRIYTRSLAATEVAELYRLGSKGRQVDGAPRDIPQDASAESRSQRKLLHFVQR